MSWNLYTIQIKDATPSLLEVAAHIGVSINDLNQEFGLILINEKKGEFAIEIKSDVTPSSNPRLFHWKGPWSTPPIDPTSDTL